MCTKNSWASCTSIVWKGIELIRSLHWRHTKPISMRKKPSIHPKPDRTWSYYLWKILNISHSAKMLLYTVKTVQGNPVAASFNNTSWKACTSTVQSRKNSLQLFTLDLKESNLKKNSLVCTAQNPGAAGLRWDNGLAETSRPQEKHPWRRSELSTLSLKTWRVKFTSMRLWWQMWVVRSELTKFAVHRNPNPQILIFDFDFWTVRMLVPGRMHAQPYPKQYSSVTPSVLLHTMLCSLRLCHHSSSVGHSLQMLPSSIE